MPNIGSRKQDLYKFIQIEMINKGCSTAEATDLTADPFYRDHTTQQLEDFLRELKTKKTRTGIFKMFNLK